MAQLSSDITASQVMTMDLRLDQLCTSLAALDTSTLRLPMSLCVASRTMFSVIAVQAGTAVLAGVGRVLPRRCRRTLTRRAKATQWKAASI